MSVRLILAALTVLTAVGSGCATKGEPAASSSPTAPPQGGVTVTSLQDLASRIDCPNLKRNPTSTTALEMGACNDEIVISTYEDRNAALRAVNELWSVNDAIDPDGTILGESAALAGANWMINCGDLAFCGEAQKKVGGELMEYDRTR